MSAEPKLAHENKWRRILWEKQAFPDNYVPPSFLSSLQRNTNVYTYTYGELVIAALSITQHVCVLFTFIAVFIHLRRESLDPRFVLWACVVGFGVGYAAWEALQGHETPPVNVKEQRVKAVKSSVLVFLALISVTPVLKTLTEATSSDSIWALSAILFTINAILADYGGPEPGPHRLTSALSMNAAISASVVLASRLKSNLAVFVLVLFAVQMFALYPILRKRLQRCESWIRISITAALATCALTVFLSAVSSTGAILLAWALIFVTFGCPAVLVWAQRYKNEIRGPWDPGVPKVRGVD